MTIEELKKGLEECASDTDFERAHIKADELLLAYINNQEISELFDLIAKWYA